MDNAIVILNYMNTISNLNHQNPSTDILLLAVLLKLARKKQWSQIVSWILTLFTNRGRKSACCESLQLADVHVLLISGQCNGTINCSVPI